MATLTTEQIEQKKQQLKQLSAKMNALVKELQEAGAWPLDDNVKKVSITGLGDDNQVVMAQELNEEDLDQATGGTALPPPSCRVFHHCVNLTAPREPGVSIP